MDEGKGEKSQFDLLMDDNFRLRTELEHFKQKVKEDEEKLKESDTSKEHEKKEREKAQHFLVQGMNKLGQYKNDLAVANKEIESMKLLLEARDKELKKTRDENEKLKGYIKKLKSKQGTNENLQSDSNISRKGKGGEDIGSLDKTKTSQAKDTNSNVQIDFSQMMDKHISDIELKASSTPTNCTKDTSNEKMKNKSRLVINEVEASHESVNRKKTSVTKDSNGKTKNNSHGLSEFIERKLVRDSVDFENRQKASSTLDSNKRMENKSRVSINEYNEKRLAQARIDPENNQKASLTNVKNGNLQNSRSVVNDHHARSTNLLKTPLNQKKRPSNYDENPTSQKKGKRFDDKCKFKERFETAFAPVEETPSDIKRRKKKVEMARIQPDVLKKDAPFYGSDSESDEDMQGKTLYCLKCPKFFNSEKLLRQHMETHVNRKVGEDPEMFLPLFKCSLCDKDRRFYNAAGIFAHIQSKHTAQNDSVMNCSFRNCYHQVKVANKLDLLSHIRSKHTEEKLFQCSKCPKNFSTYTALKDHEKKHISGKQCHICLRFYTLEKCYNCSKKK